MVPTSEPYAPVSNISNGSIAPYKFQRPNTGGRRPSQTHYSNSNSTVQPALSSPPDLDASDQLLLKLLRRAEKQLAGTLLRQIDIINRLEISREAAFDLVRAVRGYEDLSDDDVDHILTPSGPVAETRKFYARPGMLNELKWPSVENLCSACSSATSSAPSSRVTSLNSLPDSSTLNAPPQLPPPPPPQSGTPDDLIPFNFCSHCYLSKVSCTKFRGTRELVKHHYPGEWSKGCTSTRSWLVAVCPCLGCDDNNTFDDEAAWRDHLNLHYRKLDDTKPDQGEPALDRFSFKLMVMRLVVWHPYALIWNSMINGYDIRYAPIWNVIANAQDLKSRPRSRSSTLKDAVKEIVSTLLLGPEGLDNTFWTEEHEPWARRQLQSLHDAIFKSVQSRNATPPDQAQTPDALVQQSTYPNNSSNAMPAEHLSVDPLAQQPTTAAALVGGPRNKRVKGKARLQDHRDSRFLPSTQQMKKSHSATASDPQLVPQSSFPASPGSLNTNEPPEKTFQQSPTFSHVHDLTDLLDEDIRAFQSKNPYSPTYQSSAPYFS